MLGRIWSFTMDGPTPLAEPTDPDVPATDADIALEQFVARLRARWESARAIVTRIGFRSA